MNNTDNKKDIPQYEGYKLLWHDEFDADTLNTEIWNREKREPGWTNAELQEYTDLEQNIFIRDGKLVLKAIKTKDADGNDYYTSGKVQTQRKRDFMYGKVVASAKVPKGQGLWPAIWLMPTDEDYYGQWPKCGEVDIMEVLGNHPNVTYSTVHYGVPHAENQGIYRLEEGNFSDDFHEYSVEWEPGEMRFYVDGKHFHTVNEWYTAYPDEPQKPYPAPFNQTFFVQINLAVGGGWPGNPDETTDFEKAEFEIEYVRVYQKDFYDTNVKRPERVYREPLADGNLIYKGDFAGIENMFEDSDWKFILLGSAKIKAEAKNGILAISPSDNGDSANSLQLMQQNISMLQGKKYRLSFDAYADEEKNLVVAISAPTQGWGRYLNDTKLALETEWKKYEIVIEMTERDDNNARLEFNLGDNESVASVYLKNVRLEAI